MERLLYLAWRSIQARAGNLPLSLKGESRISSRRQKPNPEAGTAKYQPTARELTAFNRITSRTEATPRVKADENGATVWLDHPDSLFGHALLMEALGTAHLDFVNGLLQQLANAGSQGQRADESAINFLLSIVKGGKPKDQFEAMLSAQMAAIHTATMTFAQRLAHVETVQQQDSAERALNKLARTFAMQMEALKRYRTGGEQKVTVQHVSVNDGGQAIVGNVSQAARETAREQPAHATAALTDARQPAMPHGLYTREAIAERRRLRILMQQSHALIQPDRVIVLQRARSPPRMSHP
jgi:hypothetical protein